jgi:hypothetical protein
VSAEQSAPSPVPDGLLIPVDIPTIEEFTKQFQSAVSCTGCHFYIDTSILVWLTQIGKAARAQFKNWIYTVGEHRFHIPVWAAHEFLTHHVHDLIGQKLSGVAAGLRRTADETYSEISPFLGESVDERPSKELQLFARDTLLQLKRLAADVGRWKEKHYQQHFNEVVGLITALGLKHRPGILEFMADIDVLERNRYTGRVPPGFKDRHKRSRRVGAKEQASENEMVGSNRYGDLMFWQELLEHASADAGITSIVIISNDTKNDWQMGGGRTPNEDIEMRSLRRGWGPIPTAHPMLRYEANYRAGITLVMVIDCEYLALLLRKMQVPADDFVDAAISSELPDERREQREAKKRKSRAATAGLRRASAISRLRESDAILAGDFPLTRASREKKNSTAVDAVLTAMFDETSSKLVLDLLDTLLSNSGTTDLVQLGRAVHLRAVEGKPFAVSRLTDLIAALPDLPENSATCLCFGILISIYFDQKNEVRLPPAALGLDELMRYRHEAFGRRSIEALKFRFRDEPKRSPFVVEIGKEKMAVSILTREAVSTGSQHVTSFQIDGIELLTLAQSEEHLRLGALFEGNKPITVGDLVKVAASRFAIPVDAIEAGEDAERRFDYDEMTGLESPEHLFVA